VHHRVLHEANGTFHWAADSYPANNVSLRSVGWDNVVIVDVAKEKTIAEIDWRGAHTMVHEQAIYQHDGECWQVETFDHENHKAFVRKVEPDYYTDAMTYTQIGVLEESATGPLVPGGAWQSGFGEVSVVEKVVGYKKIKFYTHENAGYGEVHLPEMQMHPMAFWLTLPEPQGAASGREAAIDALRGIGVAFETVATLALMCDPRDLGTTLGGAELDGQGVAVPGALGKVRGGVQPGYCPTLFVYEHTPGGVGLAERMYQQREVLVQRALKLIESCSCASGCPACVGPSDASGSGYSRKRRATDLLREVTPATS
jgi:DEAD/DEAH box helicase domain-containing protein